MESVKAALKKINPEVDFYMQPEAQEFRQTQALMNQVTEAQVEKESLFPDSIWSELAPSRFRIICIGAK